jgi:hypothetical protein
MSAPTPPSAAAAEKEEEEEDVWADGGKVVSTAASIRVRAEAT